jgi:hypothetical protein
MKAFKRIKLNAAAAWKKGERKEAYDLWAKAAQSRAAHRDKKKNKNKGEGAPAEGAAPAA